MKQKFNMTYVYWDKKGNTKYSPEFHSPDEMNKWLDRHADAIRKGG